MAGVWTPICMWTMSCTANVRILNSAKAIDAVLCWGDLEVELMQQAGLQEAFVCSMSHDKFGSKLYCTVKCTGSHPHYDIYKCSKLVVTVYSVCTCSGSPPKWIAFTYSLQTSHLRHFQLFWSKAKLKSLLNSAYVIMFWYRSIICRILWLVLHMLQTWWWVHCNYFFLPGHYVNCVYTRSYTHEFVYGIHVTVLCVKQTSLY